ncbi:9463_t:CDS:2 [Dentiscutata erythropus]|uniref:9463_t:CDS:1 n=1 Tax=Dentiscutata erythropus TaxID=1348616 RepID=A0A9N9P4T8_9GLOM|nr:9463_t:CDS:2 [Dentiscutata erythropus]
MSKETNPTNSEIGLSSTQQTQNHTVDSHGSATDKVVTAWIGVVMPPILCLIGSYHLTINNDPSKNPIGGCSVVIGGIANIVFAIANLVNAIKNKGAPSS